MKKAVALFLSLIMVMNLASACSEGHFRFASDDSITRGDWISMLADCFGFEDYRSNIPYYSDIDKNDELFDQVQSCSEWGILKDVQNRIRKKDKAKVGFVISTAVYAVGGDLTWYNGTSEEKCLQYALDNELIPRSVDLNDYATAEQCDYILEAAQRHYLEMDIKPVEKVVINPGVNDVRNYGKIEQTKDSEYVFSDMEPVEGEVYLLPGTSVCPEGIAVKIVAVNKNDDGTYTAKTEVPELYEVFDELECAGVAVPLVDEIQTEEGIVITSINYNSIGEASSTQKDEKKASGFSFMDQKKTDSTDYSLLDGIKSKDKALSFSFNINLTKGTVGINPKWDKDSLELEQLITGTGSASPEGGELFKKTSIIPDKTLFGPDPYKESEKALDDYRSGNIDINQLKEALKKVQNDDLTEKVRTMENKFQSGYEVLGEASITELYLVPSISTKTLEIFGADTGIPIKVDNFSIELRYTASLSATIRGDLKEDLRLLTVPFTFGPLSGNIGIYLTASLNGELSLKAEVTNGIRTEYEDGKFRQSSTHSSSAGAEVEVTVEAGPTVKLKLLIAGVPLLDAKLSAYVRVKRSKKVSASTEWTETDKEIVIDRKTSVTTGIEGCFPIIKFSVGTDEGTLANKLKLTYKKTLMDDSSDKVVNFTIVPKQEIVLWQDHQALPKEPQENVQESENQDSQSETENSDNSGSGNNGTEDTDAENEWQEVQTIGGNISISSYYVHLEVGQSSELKIECPDGYKDNDFEWSSDDNGIASVKNGIINAHKPGSATITAQSHDGKYWVVCAVFVGETGKIISGGVPDVGSGGGGGGSW